MDTLELIKAAMARREQKIRKAIDINPPLDEGRKMFHQADEYCLMEIMNILENDEDGQQIG